MSGDLQANTKSIIISGNIDLSFDKTFSSIEDHLPGLCKKYEFLCSFWSDNDEITIDFHFDYYDYDEFEHDDETLMIKMDDGKLSLHHETTSMYRFISDIM